MSTTASQDPWPACGSWSSSCRCCSGHRTGQYTGVSAREAVREGLAQLWLTVKRARRVSNVALYLVARMLYTDGKVAILAYSGIYAAGVFHWELTDLLLFALVLAPFSISGGFIGGWLDNRLGSKRAIQISVGLSCLGMVGAVSTTPDQILFLPYDASAAQPLWSVPYFQTVPEVVYIVVVMTLAITITAAFCTSRTMMARIAPVSMMSQFFGLYAFPAPPHRSSATRSWRYSPAHITASARVSPR